MPTLYLIGMMGSGKSTLSRLLSRMVRVPAVDLDDALVAADGRSIPEIFAADGESGFRKLETRILEQVAGKRQIVATGGGIITTPENIRIMRSSGTVIWLRRTVSDILRDIHPEGRPKLAGDPEGRLRRLAAEREALYRACAHLEFYNHGQPEDCARALSALPELRECLQLPPLS